MTDTVEPMGARIDQQQLAQQLMEAATADGVELVGPTGCWPGYQNGAGRGKVRTPVVVVVFLGL